MKDTTIESADVMRSRIASHPWAASSIGAMSGWPLSLRSALDVMLASPLPMTLHWGSELLGFYNDAYNRLETLPRPTLGEKLREGTVPSRTALEEVRAGRTVSERTELSGVGPGVEVAHGPLWNGDSNVIGVVSTFKPPTDYLAKREVQRRMRNTFATIRSIARRMSESSDDPREVLMHLDGRLEAYLRVQSSSAAISEGFPLDHIVEEELLQQMAHVRPDVTIDGPPVRMVIEAADVMGLAIHELATNAVKFGALGEPGGLLRVQWQRSGPTAPLVFEWRESGLEGVERERTGFGMEVLERTVPYELDADVKVDFRSDGIDVRMAVPAQWFLPVSIERHDAWLGA